MLPIDRLQSARKEKLKKASQSSSTSVFSLQTAGSSSSTGSPAYSMQSSASSLLDSLRQQSDEEEEEDEMEEEEEEEEPTVALSDSDYDSSDLSESDDDDKTELSAEDKLHLLSKKMKKRQAKYAKWPKIVSLDSSSERKAKAFQRVEDNSKRARVTIGTQRHRLEPGRGFKVEAGGNSDTRPDGVIEPKAEYEKIFEKMKTMGKDEHASELYKMATGNDLPSKKTLSDEAIAEIVLYYLNNDASEIENKLGEPSNLTVHLSKLTAIFELAERSRSMEADEPYDATDLIKGVLEKIQTGEKTLREGFYKGKGGEDSIFIGAPSKKHSKSKIGGAEVLRNPFDFDDRLERQMEVFPKNKGKFKKAVNEKRGLKRKGEDRVVSQEETDQLLEEEKGPPLKKKKTAPKQTKKTTDTLSRKKKTRKTVRTTKRVKSTAAKAPASSSTTTTTTATTSTSTPSARRYPVRSTRGIPPKK